MTSTGLKMRPYPAAVVTAVTLSFLAAACGGGSSDSAPTTTTSAAASATTAATTTTTVAVSASSTPTLYAPADPQSSPAEAADTLVEYWEAGDRAGASAIAAPAAVFALFSISYPAGYLQARGCTDTNVNPGTCTYGNTETFDIYEFGVTDGPTGWYISSVTAES